MTARFLSLALLLAAPSALAGKKAKAPPAAEAASPAESAAAPPPPAPLPPPVDLPCDFAEGASWSYTMTKHEEDTQSGALDSTTPLTISVVSTGNPMVLRYDLGPTTFDGVELDQVSPELKLAASMSESLDLDLELTDGSVTGIRNYDAVIALVEPFLDELTKGQPPEVAQMTKELFRDPVNGPMVMLRDVAPFFTVTCGRLDRSQPVEVPSQLASPFGGPPLPAVEKLWVESLDGGVGTVKHTAALTGESAEALKQMVAQLAGGGEAAKFVEGMDLGVPVVETVSVYAMSLSDGMPMRVEVAKRIEVMGQKREDTRTWVRTTTK